MKTNFFILAISACFLFTVNATAQTKTYDFKDPKGVNAVSFVVDSKLEPNAGFADGIEGSVTIDHANKKILKGAVTIPTKSITMSNGTMTRVLHSKDWLNRKKNPNVTFVFSRVISIKQTTDELYEVTVQGEMTLNGVTKTLTAPVSLSFHPGQLGKRNKGASGDLAVLRTVFNINRADFNISPNTPAAIVGETINLTMNIAGASR